MFVSDDTTDAPSVLSCICLSPSRSVVETSFFSVVTVGASFFSTVTVGVTFFLVVTVRAPFLFSVVTVGALFFSVVLIFPSVFGSSFVPDIQVTVGLFIVSFAGRGENIQIHRPIDIYLCLILSLCLVRTNFEQIIIIIVCWQPVSTQYRPESAKM